MSLEGINQEMESLGITKTVYSLVYPETNEVTDRVLGDKARVDNWFDKPYTKRQDSMHEAFMEGYANWVRDVAPIDRRQYLHAYPTSGSSEAIRETIAEHATSQMAKGAKPQIHVFDGEYEGYKAYADTHRVKLVSHDRRNYERSIADQAHPGDRFYLSNPSGIDGNIWTGYDEFMQWMTKEVPDMKVMLDLAYVGTIANPSQIIDTTHANIAGIFFSLSKSFGTYYQRIGGMFSKEPVPGIWGNMWFKSLPAIGVGAELTRSFGPTELPSKYQHVQMQAVQELQGKLGDNVKASDVILLATQPVTPEDSEMKRFLTRAQNVRYCLTPSLDQIIINHNTHA